VSVLAALFERLVSGLFVGAADSLLLVGKADFGSSCNVQSLVRLELDIAVGDRAS
jgi:hypothetical protein